jgi:hypothetical protein
MRRVSGELSTSKQFPLDEESARVLSGLAGGSYGLDVCPRRSVRAAGLLAFRFE